MKFLIFGLGNMHADYMNTRHNIGFEVVDRLAKIINASFNADSHCHRAEGKIKGRQVQLIKPTTYMNLSGKAVRYWVQKEKLELTQILVITDDLNLEYGAIRIRSSGSDGGHNGLKDIQLQLGTIQYPRMRIGIGSNFSKGRQVDYVLGSWSENEKAQLDLLLDTAAQAVQTYILEGIQSAMNRYNSFKLPTP